MPSLHRPWSSSRVWASPPLGKEGRGEEREWGGGAVAGGELRCGGGGGKKEGERCEQEREPWGRGGAQREEKVRER